MGSSFLRSPRCIHRFYFVTASYAVLPTNDTLQQLNCGKFIKYLGENGITGPEGTTARYIRAYLSTLVERGLSDSYIHGYARAIRTLIRFWHSEKYIPEPITFQMPMIAKKRLPVLSAEEVRQVISACHTPRDKALVLVLTDSGLRRAELCALNWRDVDIPSGLVRVVSGKGGKARSVVIGVKTRRALLAYRREINPSDNEPHFQTKKGNRLTHNGLRSALLRIGSRVDVHVTPHALRRTFTTLSLRAGMNLIQLQAMLGHSSLEMTRRYIQMLDDDLLAEHKVHGPVDSFL